MFRAMPCLQNPRHEKFVRHWLKTSNASEAYRRAGYETTTNLANRVNASRLLAHANVQRRIKELERSMAQKTEISLATLLSDLAEDRALARSLGQASAAVQATQLAAKLTGHLVDRKETGGPGDFAGLKTAGEVLDAIREQLGDKAAAAIEAALAPSEALPAAEVIEVPDEKSLN
jgi:Terminase small subunit